MRYHALVKMSSCGGRCTIKNYETVGTINLNLAERNEEDRSSLKKSPRLRLSFRLRIRDI